MGSLSPAHYHREWRANVVVEQIRTIVQSVLGLGLEPKVITLPQMLLRTVILYGFTLIVLRVGDRRFLSKQNAFDVVIAILLGSVLSRAINGSAPFFETLGAGLILVVAHWLTAVAAFRWTRFGRLVKGQPEVLIRDGDIDWDHMRGSAITENDLREMLRTSAHLNDPGKVKLSYLERNGRISVIPRPSGPQVVEVAVQDGVQTVRIQLGQSSE